MSVPGAANNAAYLTARQTTQLLEIKLQTLYAYVSRGLIHSTSQPGTKARVYLRSDVERVHARALARSGHGPVAAGAMNHGQPIIPSSITEITNQGPRYRGKLATDLAEMRASFESVAELLWTGLWDPADRRWKISAPSPALVQLIESLADSRNGDQLAEVLALVTLHSGSNPRPKARPLQAPDAFDDARQLIGVLVGCCGLASPERRYVPLRPRDHISEGLLRSLGGVANPDTHAAIDIMLTLLADHELSPGTLAARVAASGGGTLHACIAAALCASSGVNVAQIFVQVHDFLSSAKSKAGLLKLAMARLDRGQTIPGFTHPLYPNGDPRARMLLNFIRTRMPSRRLLAVCDFVSEIENTTGLYVRHEVPMVALTLVFGLPRQAPSAIFLLSRIAGWVAHIQEQRLSSQLLRPRAKYVSPHRE